MADLEGKVAMVTGSSSGIGAAVAAAMAPTGCENGARLEVIAGAGQRLARQLPTAMYVQADIADEHDAARVVAAAGLAPGPVRAGRAHSVMTCHAPRRPEPDRGVMLRSRNVRAGPRNRGSGRDLPSSVFAGVGPLSVSGGCTATV
jgi:NAD(P)-dependent dehydrogenase (short-subunit alcohol dehydrogenase family)